MISSLNLSKHSHSITMFITGASSALALGYLYCKLKCQKTNSVCPINNEEKKRSYYSINSI